MFKIIFFAALLVIASAKPLLYTAPVAYSAYSAPLAAAYTAPLAYSAYSAYSPYAYASPYAAYYI